MTAMPLLLLATLLSSNNCPSFLSCSSLQASLHSLWAASQPPSPLWKSLWTPSAHLCLFVSLFTSFHHLPLFFSPHHFPSPPSFSWTNFIPSLCLSSHGVWGLTHSAGPSEPPTASTLQASWQEWCAISQSAHTQTQVHTGCQLGRVCSSHSVP